MEPFSTYCKVAGLNDELGLVFGFGIVCLQKSASGEMEPYFDLQEHHIPEDEMLPAVMDFQLNSGEADVMHDNGVDGPVVFSFPLTTDIAKALGVDTPKTGWLVGVRPSREIYAKFKSREFTGFSIGGRHGTLESAQ